MTDALEQQMKLYALGQLKHRQENKPVKIINGTLHSGSPMYFYCAECGWLSDLLAEGFISKPRRLCSECQLLKDKGWGG